MPIPPDSRPIDPITSLPFKAIKVQSRNNSILFFASEVKKTSLTMAEITWAALGNPQFISVLITLGSNLDGSTPLQYVANRGGGQASPDETLTFLDNSPSFNILHLDRHKWEDLGMPYTVTVSISVFDGNNP